MADTPKQELGAPAANPRRTHVTIEDGVVTIVLPEAQAAAQSSAGAGDHGSVDEPDTVIDLTDGAVATSSMLATHPKRVVQAYRSGLDAQAARRSPGRRSPLGLYVDDRA